MSDLRCQTDYSGNVQGVGFRATALRIAQTLRITGWVRNEPDGSVRLVAEGPEQEIRTLHERINDSMGHLIHRKTDTFSTSLGEFERFEIRR